MAETDTVLKDHLEQRKRNAKCTSKTTQNEIISIIADYIRESTTKSLQLSTSVFSIIADEVTGKYDNKEMLSICVRFIEGENISEVFLDFVELIRTTGAHIAEAIMLSLAQNKVDILKCRGQAYDGAAAMSSERVEVQARIKVVCPLALYTHCRSHVLNLSIASACKVPQISSMVDVINETFKFFNNPPKRQRFFEHILDAFESDCTKSKLLGLCRTHWVQRYTCYETFYELYVYICCCLEAIINPSVYLDKNLDQYWDWDSDSKVKAQGLLHSLKSMQNIVSFLVAKNALELIRPIAVKLQKKDQDIVTASNMIDETISNIKDLRENIETEFCDWFSDVKRIVEAVGSEISVPRIAGKQTYRANATTDGATPEGNYRVNVAVPFLDHLHQEMSSRFDHENRVGNELFNLVPSIIITLINLQPLVEGLLFWKLDMPSPSSLLCEIKLWQKHWTKRSEVSDIPEDLSTSFVSCDADVYPNIIVLLKIGCTLPVSSCEAEKSFYRRVKSYTRSSMTTERLAGLTLMHLHNDIEIDFDLICQQYISKYNRRMFKSCILFESMLHFICTCHVIHIYCYI